MMLVDKGDVLGLDIRDKAVATVRMVGGAQGHEGRAFAILRSDMTYTVEDLQALSMLFEEAAQELANRNMEGQ